MMKKGTEPGPDAKKDKHARPEKADTSIAERRRKKEKIAREIAKELHGVRAVTQEVIDQLEIRLGAEIADLIRVFEGETVAGEKHPLPSAQAEMHLLVRVRELKVKPRKGRLKDLDRITAVLADIRAVLENPPAKGSRGK